MLTRIALLAALTLLFAACGGGGSEGPPAADPTSDQQQAGPTQPPPPIGQLVVQGSEPVSFAFTPDGRLFFNLRQRGEIRWIDLNTWDPNAPVGAGELFATEDVWSGNECGLLGIVVDPDFATNGYIYVYTTEPDPNTEGVAQPLVVRYTDVEGVGTDRTIIIGDLPLTNPAICAHVGGTLRFGPDGYLYLSIGNNERKLLAAELSNPLGSILRFDKTDGSAAPDNPFVDRAGADPRIYATGLRNPYAFAFHPETGVLYATDNGPGNCDELNLIEAGADYGVPESLPSPVEETCLGLGGVDPIYLFALPGMEPNELPSNVAPAGTVFLTGDAYPGLGVGMLMCEFLSGTMRYLEFGEPDEVTRDIKVTGGCHFNVAVDDDGIIYYSQRDQIYRLPPELLPEFD